MAVMTDDQLEVHSRCGGTENVTGAQDDSQSDIVVEQHDDDEVRKMRPAQWALA